MRNYNQTVYLKYNSLRIISWGLGIFGVLGNIFVILSLLLSSRQRKGLQLRRNKRFNTLSIRNSPALLVLLHLALADLGSSIYFSIMNSGDLISLLRANYVSNGTLNSSKAINRNLYLSPHLGNITALEDTWIINHLCSAARFFSQIGLGCANMFTLFITIRRYLAIYHPIHGQKFNMNATKLFICFGWLVSLILSLTITIGSDFMMKWILQQTNFIFQYNIIVHLCQPVTVGFILYLSAFEVFMNTASCIASIILYIKISCRLRKSLRRHTSELVYKTQHRINVMLACIVLTNAVVYLPITFLLVCALFQTFNFESLSLYWPIATLLSYSNCVIDPFIFIFLRITNISQRSLRNLQKIRPVSNRPQVLANNVT
ncbi:hypothetical protein TrispH2_008132 [Trichoplax sp. H2]|nr:hypothetical protein TrispH2_008132 [Trichoplax sp. H2]|eukprot:RDD39159.1 hypothetical protein TrispH2_008132 [Trichoplax sp. H2]